MTSDSDLDGVVELSGHLAILCRESAGGQDTPELKCMLHDVASYAHRMQLRLQRVAGEMSVAFVGLSNVGKSTLLDALLGAELAPRRNGPCTPLAIEYRYGDSYRIQLFGGERRKLPAMGSAEEAICVLTDVLRDSKWFSKDRPPRVKLFAPLEILKSGAVLVDTPGFGSAGGPENENHDVALQAFLKRSHALVVWVVNGQQGVTAAEKVFHDRHLAILCDNVVVTSCEDWPESDKERFRRKFGMELGRRYLHFHFVSGLAALRARNAKDDTALMASGLPSFEQVMLDAFDRAKMAGEVVVSLHEIATELVEAMHEFSPDRPLWREDSWYRWRDLALAHPAKASLDGLLAKGCAASQRAAAQT
jgi:GTP-binding protein EngB required for normal cell division